MFPRPNASWLNRQGHETAEWVFMQSIVQLPPRHSRAGGNLTPD